MDFPAVLEGPSYVNPLDVKLRQKLKRDFLQALSHQPNPFEGKTEGCKFWVFGSSIMNIAWHTGTQFPLKAKKALDLDIGIYYPPPINVGNVRDLIDAQVEKTVKGAVLSLDGHIYQKQNTGYKDPPVPDSKWRSRVGNGNLVKTETYQLVYPGSSRYKDNFFLARHYSKKEIEDVLKDDPEASSIPIPEDGHIVVLDAEVFTSRMPMLLDPKPHKFFDEENNIESNNTPIVVDDYRNMLAKKLARAIYPQRCAYSSEPTGFKPRDLIDIYNVIHAQPALMDLDPASPNSDIPLLRMLMVTNMRSLNKEFNRVNLMDFDPSDMAHIEVWRQEIEHIFMNTYKRLNNEMGQRIFHDVQDLYRKLFPERDITEGADGKLIERVQLHPEESKFFDRIDGFERISAGGASVVRRMDPQISPELIMGPQDEYLNKHGNSQIKEMLRRNILAMPGLQDRVAHIREVRERAIGGE